MPTKYVPTGRPPGRPKKPEVERQNIQDIRAVMANTTVDRASVPMNAICPDCYPAGWAGFGADGTGVSLTAQCVHGTWVKRL